MSKTDLNTRNKRLIILIAAVAVLLVTAVTVIIVQQLTDKFGGEAGPEAGVYYYDVSGGEILLSLNAGRKFTIEGRDVNKSGDYTLNGDKLTLDFVRYEDGTADAIYNGTSVVLSYQDATLTFLKKVYFNVTFETNGGSTVTGTTVLNGKVATAPASPTKEGYQFLGWYADEECTKRFDFTTTVITADTAVYALWIEDPLAN